MFKDNRPMWGCKGKMESIEESKTGSVKVVRESNLYRKTISTGVSTGVSTLDLFLSLIGTEYITELWFRTNMMCNTRGIYIMSVV